MSVISLMRRIFPDTGLPAESGLTGAEAAKRMLAAAGLDADVRDKGSGRHVMSVWPDSVKQIGPLVVALEDAGVEVRRVDTDKSMPAKRRGNA